MPVSRPVPVTLDHQDPANPTTPTMPHSRRDFLATLGALSAASLAVPPRLRGEAYAKPFAEAGASSRGLALSPDDFLLAPGLVYLQTGSLGPTPRPVIDATI